MIPTPEKLRTELIEVGARELLPTMVWIDQDGEPFHVDWVHASDAQRDHALDVFAECFDALLDSLQARSNEWEGAVTEQLGSRPRPSVDQLLDVLQETFRRDDA